MSNKRLSLIFIIVDIRNVKFKVKAKIFSRQLHLFLGNRTYQMNVDSSGILADQRNSQRKWNKSHLK